MIIHACIIVKFLRKEKSVSRLRETDKILISIKEILELLASAGMTKLSESLGFDLTDTLTGNVKFLADLLKGVRMSALKTETQRKHLSLTGSKGFKHIVKLLLEKKN